MIHNMIGGGGQGDGPVESGTIVVTYPSGATCTVTGNGQTYTALDTSGAAAFVVEPGTYTVTATQGSDSASQSTTVAAGGWVEVELTFTLYLYNNGNQYVSVTGGWTASGYDGLSVPVISGQLESNAMRFEGVNNYHVVLGTANTIDLTQYTTITFKGNIESARAPDNLCLTFQITTSKGAMNDGEIAYKDTNKASGSYTVTMDVSNVNRKAYIAVITGGLSICVGTVSSIVLS